MGSLSLYQFPALYEALLFADADMEETVRDWMERYLDGPVERVMDPACGPGTWLAPFSKEGIWVAGNDLEPKMIAEAKRTFVGAPSEWRVGDMTALSFAMMGFDLAINLDASVGHLPDDAAVVRHLESVGRCLRPGGVYLLGLFVLDGEEVEREAILLYRSGKVSVDGGGWGAVEYASLVRDPVNRYETIQLQVTTEEVEGVPAHFVEEYNLLTFPCRVLEGILSQVATLELVATHTMELSGYPSCSLRRNCGDVTLVLRCCREDG